MTRLKRFARGLGLAATVLLPACSSGDGDNDGNSSSSLSGLPKGERLADLSDADNTRLCEAVVKKGSASSRTDCKVVGFEAVRAAPFVSGPGIGPTDADVQKICTDAEAACEKTQATAVDPGARCAGPSTWPSTCQATVGEYEACVTDMIAWQSANESMRTGLVPACSKLAVADLCVGVNSTCEAGKTLDAYKWTGMPASCAALGETCKPPSTPAPRHEADGGACNVLLNAAPTIDETGVAEDMPADAAGGTVVEGTYHLTSHTKYVGVGGAAGPLGSTRKQTVVIIGTGGGKYSLESVFSKDGGPDDHVDFSVTLNGSEASSDITCPAPQFFGTSGFTATPTAYTLYDAAKSQVDVYTLVP